MPLLSTPVILGTALAVLIGLSLGLLGGGGSILTLPILVYVVGLPTHEAIALSLLVVGTTSIAALIPHARHGRVRWKTGALFGITSMVGAYAGGRLAHLVPATLLLLGFGAMMVITAFGMMRDRKEATSESSTSNLVTELPLVRIAVIGLLVGSITGLVGAGGGFVVVPALVLLARLPMHTAVGTSLLVISMNSYAALAGHLGSVELDLGLAVLFSSAAVLGSFLGSTLSSRVPQAMLRRGFAWFVIVMAVFILFQEIPRALGRPLELGTAWPLLLGVSVLPILMAIVDLTRRARATPSGAPSR